MAGFNGSGTYVRNYNWVNDKTNGINITASRFDTEDNGFATGLSTCICKDGQTTTSAVIPFASGIVAAAGTTSALMMGKIGEVTTGLYSSGTGNIDVASGGTRVGGFTSSGINSTNIGATTPGTGNFTTLTATSIVGPISANAVGKVAITQPATGSTLTIADGKTLTASHTLTINGGDAAVLAIAAAKTLTVSNTMTLAGGDSSVITFPNATVTVATLTGTETLTNKTLTSPAITGATLGSSTATTQSVGDNSTKVATTAYADASAAANSGIVLISTSTASNSASITITGIDNTYNKHIIEFDNLVLASIDGINMQFSTDGGSTFLAGSNMTGSIQTLGLGNTGANFSAVDTGTPGAMRIVPQAWFNASATAGQGTSGTIKFQSKCATSQWQVISWEVFDSQNGGGRGQFAIQANTTINAVKFITANAGHNLTTGSFHLMGIKGT